VSVVIQVENLSKLYRLGEVSTGTLSHDLNRWWHKVRGKEDPYLKIGQVNDRTRKVKNAEVGNQNSEPAGFSDPSPNFAERPQTPSPSDYFYALKDINFSVNQGEVLGIIGRNGAGKSTLLKILSRVTTPTTGTVKVKGRIASLLEVGTGFHPELTGRDNVYLNGAILGMTRAEIRSKFDEIIAFAEIDKFIDTPVKRYSSGMYVRLAFAVAAHLEPEILIVDEVLAVGDQQFQDKCLGKMQEVSQGGRTVLFVSHNMAAVQRLCSKGVLIDSGRLDSCGIMNDVLGRYLETTQPTTAACDNLNSAKVDRHGSGLAKFLSFSLKKEDGQALSIFPLGTPFYVELAIHAKTRIHNTIFGFSFITQNGLEIMGTAAHDGGISTTLQKGTNVYRCLISPNILLPGRYTLRGAIFSAGEVFDHIDSILSFEISDVRSDEVVAPSGHKVGHVYCPYQWSSVQVNL